MRTTSDINSSIEDILDNKKLRFFVRWYCNGAIKEDYDKIKNYCSGFDMDKAIETYLDRNDVKEAIAFVTKENKDLDIIKIYHKMLKKALDGDVNSANWIMKFRDSKFFDTNKSEIDKIIEGLDVDE